MGARAQAPEIKRETIVYWGGDNLRVAKISRNYAVCEIIASGRILEGILLNVALKDLASAVVIKQ